MTTERKFVVWDPRRKTEGDASVVDLGESDPKPVITVDFEDEEIGDFVSSPQGLFIVSDRLKRELLLANEDFSFIEADLRDTTGESIEGRYHVAHLVGNEVDCVDLSSSIRCGEEFARLVLVPERIPPAASIFRLAEAPQLLVLTRELALELIEEFAGLRLSYSESYRSVHVLRLQGEFLEAVSNNDTKEARRLLDAGVDPNAVISCDDRESVGRRFGNYCGKHALDLAIRDGLENVEMMKLLIDRGIDAGHSEYGHRRFEFAKGKVKELLRESYLASLSASERSSYELFEAAGKGDAKAVTRLLRAGADVNYLERLDGKSRTALSEAFYSGSHLEIAEQLIRHGAKAAHASEGGQGAECNVLHGAALRDDVERLEFLFQLGADLNAVDADGLTPLVRAVRSCREKAARWLLSNGADPAIKDRQGFSADVFANFVRGGGRKAKAPKVPPRARSLHRSALGYNWDNGLGRLRKMLANPDCDQGTALAIYWMGAPEAYFKAPEEDDREQQRFLLELEERILSKQFKTNEILFNPQFDLAQESFGVGHDWTATYADERPSRHQIPAVLREPNIVDSRWEMFGRPPGRGGQGERLM